MGPSTTPPWRLPARQSDTMRIELLEQGPDSIAKFRMPSNTLEPNVIDRD
jgi:hypothetical protein